MLTMNIHANTVLGILDFVERNIDFNTEGLLRLPSKESSIDMFFFKITQYIELEKTKPNPDIRLKYFDFNGYLRDWIYPEKKSPIIDETGHITLAEVIKHAFIKLDLPNKSRSELVKITDKYLRSSELQDGCEFAQSLFCAIQKKRVDDNCRLAIIKFIEFGQAICENPNNRMDVEQTSKMLAPCFITPIAGYSQEANYVRNCSKLYQSMLTYCFTLERDEFELLITGSLTVKSKKGFSLPSLFNSEKSKPNIKNSYSDSFLSPDTTQSLDSGSSSGELNFSFQRLKLESDLSIENIVDLIRKGDVDQLRIYFSNHPNASNFINTTKTFFDRSLLHVAVLAQNSDVIRLLGSFGGDINVFDKNNNTPLHYAAMWPKYSKPFCPTTLTALFEFENAFIGSKIRKNNQGKTALKLAEESDLTYFNLEFIACRNACMKKEMANGKRLGIV